MLPTTSSGTCVYHFSPEMLSPLPFWHSGLSYEPVVTILDLTEQFLFWFLQFIASPILCLLDVWSVRWGWPRTREVGRRKRKKKRVDIAIKLVPFSPPDCSPRSWRQVVPGGSLQLKTWLWNASTSSRQSASKVLVCLGVVVNYQCGLVLWDSQNHSANHYTNAY